MFHCYGSGGHQWLDRKTEATETSKASVNRSYGKGNYVEIIETNNSEMRTTKNPSLRPIFFEKTCFEQRESLSSFVLFIFSLACDNSVYNIDRIHVYSNFFKCRSKNPEEYDRREVRPRGLPRWVH